MAHQDVLPLYINGRTVAATSGDTFTVTNPYDGSLLATVGQASRGDLDEAVRTAQQGQRVWAAMTGMERSRILLRAVALLRERNDELAELETRNTGKPISETASVDIVTGADALASILSWQNWEELFELAKFVGVSGATVKGTAAVAVVLFAIMLVYIVYHLRRMLRTEQ